jgi:hypothetical protein
LNGPRVFVRFDHVARVIIHANHSIMWSAVMLGVADCVADCVRLVIPERVEWECLRN